MRSRVERYLARPLSTRAQAPLSVVARVDAVSGGFTAGLVLRSPEGQRERKLDDPDCVLVADATAFIVALAIDPTVRAEDAPLTAEERSSARTGAAETSSATAAGTAAGAAARPGGASSDAAAGDVAETAVPEEAKGADDGDAADAHEPDEPDEPPSPPLKVGGALGLRAGAGWQPLHALAARVSAYGALRLGRVARVELSLGYVFARDKELPIDTDASASFDALLGALVGCVVGGRGATELGLCLGAQAGIVRGDAEQPLSDGRTDTAPHAQVVAGPLLLHRLGSGVVLRVQAWPSVALARPRFRLATGELVYQAEIIGFAAAVGAEVRFD